MYHTISTIELNNWSRKYHDACATEDKISNNGVKLTY